MSVPEDFSKKTRAQRLKDFMLSAAAGGAALQGGQALMGSGTKSFGQIAKAGGKGAVISSLLAGTAGLAGDLILGAPKASETDGFTNRGAVGGLVGGGLLGAGIGGVAASGKLGKMVDAIGKTGKIGSKIAAGLKNAAPSENMVIDKFTKWGADPSKTRTMLGSMLGASLGGAGSAAIGSDEGMQADFIKNKAQAIRNRKKKKKVENGV